MTDIVKEILNEKLKIALDKEGLNRTQLSRLLGLATDNYGSQMLNPKQWGKVPPKAWEVVQRWSNSGESIRRYSEKYKLERTNRNITPPKVSEAEEKHGAKVVADQTEPLNKDLPIEKIFSDKPKVTPETNKIPLSDLQALLDALNGLKAIGYTVEITIREVEQ